MLPLQGHFPDKEPTHGSKSTLDSTIYFFSNLQVFQRYPVQPTVRPSGHMWRFISSTCTIENAHFSGPVLPSTSEKFHRGFGQRPSATNRSVATLKWGKINWHKCQACKTTWLANLYAGPWHGAWPPLSLAGSTKNAAGRQEKLKTKMLGIPWNTTLCFRKTSPKNKPWSRLVLALTKVRFG